MISIESTRNYAILHIVADEAKVFITKVNFFIYVDETQQERAPILLCIEAYRPEELLYLQKEEQKNLKESEHTS